MGAAAAIFMLVGRFGQLLRRRLHAPRLGRELDVAARLPVVLGLRALPQDAHPQVARVHLAVAGAHDDADVADLRFFVSHFRDDPIALLDAVARDERGMIQRIDVGVDRASRAEVYSESGASSRSRESNDHTSLTHRDTRQGLRRDDFIFFSVVSHQGFKSELSTGIIVAPLWCPKSNRTPRLRNESSPSDEQGPATTPLSPTPRAQKEHKRGHNHPSSETCPLAEHDPGPPAPQ